MVVDSPVNAGSTFTVTVTAVDYVGVTSIALTFDSPAEVEPDPAGIAAMVTCDDEVFSPATTITVVYQCTATSLAQPGTWIVTAAATDIDGSPPATDSTTFDIVAG